MVQIIETKTEIKLLILNENGADGMYEMVYVHKYCQLTSFYKSSNEKRRWLV